MYTNNLRKPGAVNAPFFFFAIQFNPLAKKPRLCQERAGQKRETERESKEETRSPFMFQLFMHKSSPKEAKRLRQLSVFSLSFFCAPNHKRKINRAVIPDDGEKFSEGIIFLFLLHNYTCSLFVLHMYKIHRVDGENKSLSFSTHSTHITSTTGGRGGPVAFMYDSHERPPPHPAKSKISTSPSPCLCRFISAVKPLVLFLPLYMGLLDP